MQTPDDETVTGRAFRLLHAFDAGVPELTLDELAMRSGLARSTAHRLASQLARHRALERSPRGWRLGVGLFELGQMVPRQQRLRDVALAYMEDLYEATRETVQLAELEGDEVLYIEIISGHRRVPTPSRRGGRLPAHCTALGKAMLAFSDDAGASWLRDNAPLERRTRSTVTDPQLLQRELRGARRIGLAYDREEASLGLRCVAAPIVRPNGTARAAISVSMPATGRITPEHAAPAVRAAARAIARELNRTRELDF